METFVKARVEAGARALNGRWYHDDAVFIAERERVFAREWIVVDRCERLAHAGDYVLAEIAGESLIVVRDEARLRAFFNVCRHRGTRICTEPAGRFAGAIRCPYHAWTYGLDGTLLTARTMDGVADFARADYPLHEAHVAEFAGFVFVSLAAQPPPFAPAFAPLAQRVAPWSIESLRVAHAIDYDLACNWKLVFQNYSECYHCPLVHPQLDRLSPSESGRNDLIDGPLLGGYSELRGGRTSLTTSGTTVRAPLPGVRDADRERVSYYTVFPTLMLSLHPDYVMVHEVRPVAVNRTRVTCSWLFAPDAIAATGFDPSDAVEFWDLTNRQDWAVCELTQAGVGSRAYTPGPYANAEGLLAAFDRYYLTRIGEVK